MTQEIREETASSMSSFFKSNLRVMVAKVKSISGNVCTVQYDDIELEARLKATEDDNTEAFVLTPKVNSNVLIIPIENGNYYLVIAVDEVEKIEYKATQTSLKITKDGIEITSGGKVKINNTANSLADLMSELFDLLNTFSVLETDQGVPKPSTPNPLIQTKVALLKTKFQTLLN